MRDDSGLMIYIPDPAGCEIFDADTNRVLGHHSEFSTRKKMKGGGGSGEWIHRIVAGSEKDAVRAASRMVVLADEQGVTGCSCCSEQVEVFTVEKGQPVSHGSNLFARVDKFSELEGGRRIVTRILVSANSLTCEDCPDDPHDPPPPPPEMAV